MQSTRLPTDIKSAERMVDYALSTCLFATRAAIHGSLKASPGSLAFGRDMILDIPLLADWNYIREHRQQQVDKRSIAENRKRFAYDYQPGDKILKISFRPSKLEPRATGPFPILRVHTNGTVTIRLNDAVIERISIRRIKPFRDETPFKSS
jgi:hypothetical protein